ncbi:MAG: HAD-IIA family hydrolase [Chloroflexi bacterium]|nr:HAD-IIA family hydrolase [Chloroflexota bacterium]
MTPIFHPRIKALIMDMDGVLWRGTQPIGDLGANFDKIRSLGLKFALATNNAGYSIDQFVEKIRGLGAKIQPEQIVTSSMAAAYLLKQRFPQGGPVYVVGQDGLIDALAQQEFYPSVEGALAVVAGTDHGFTYQKLVNATVLIRKGVPFYGTNPDRSYPTPDGLLPGAGSILAAIEAATDVKPFIAGKPYPPMMDMALERLGTTLEETLVVGDRLDTDILWAQNSGCHAALMLSGVSTPEDAQAWKPQPDLVVPELAALLEILENESKE